MPRATAAEAAATAVRVREAATEQFSLRGYAAASVEEIAEAAAVTRGAVYHHFGSKPGLFAAVVHALQAQVADAVVAAAGDADPATALRRGSHAFLDAITTGRHARILLVDAPAALGWDAWRRADAEASAAQLHEALADAGIAGHRLDAMTALLSGAMNEAALWLSERPGDAVACEAAHHALDELLDAVTAEPAATAGTPAPDRD